MRILPDEVQALRIGESVNKELLSYSIDIPHKNTESFVLPYKQSVHNALFSVTERVLATDNKGTKPIAANEHEVVKLLPMAKTIAKIVRADNVCKKMDLLAYAEARPQRTRNRYRKIVGEMVNAGCHNVYQLSTLGTTLARIATTRAFIKIEGTLHSVKKINVPRLINPRDPKYNVLLGCYLSHLEGPILKSFDKLYGHKNTMMKGKTIFEKAAIAQNYFGQGYWAYSLDMARFDQHVNAKLLNIEHAVYKGIFPGDNELRVLLKAQVSNKIKVKAPDGSFHVDNWEGRCSGDVNTSLGNCVLMGLMCKGLVSGDMRLMCDGDDTIIWAKPGTFDVDVATRHFRKYGMNMTLEGIATKPEELTFCQHYFISTPNGVRMCRSPDKAMLRDVMSFGINGGDIAQFRKLLYAVGECGMSQYWGMPILQSIYQMNLRLGLRSKHKVFRELSRSNFGMGMTTKRDAVPIDAPTRLSFWEATGYTPLQQVTIERWCDEFELTDDVIDVPVPAWHSKLYKDSCEEGHS